MLVVFHHALHGRDGSFSPFHDVNLGDPGVMIFFVISGFVMLQSCRDEPELTFAWRRIVRFVPLYWIFTLVFFLLIARADVATGDPLWRLAELLSCVFFIPHHHSGVPEQIWPILGSDERISMRSGGRDFKNI